MACKCTVCGIGACTSMNIPLQVATTHVMSALNLSYKYATSFQTFFGTCLFVANAPRRVFRMAGRLGLSVSHSTLLKRLRQLAKDSGRRVKRLGASVKDSAVSFLIVWDNVNKRQRPWQTTLSKQVCK